MIIERQNQNIIIKASSAINMSAVQKLIDYINVLEIVTENKGTEEQALELSREANKNWWNQNRSRFIK
ncbi:hypothetical protein ACFP1I_16195 [Dyadobacter subterraneus]|uniref:Uncharacterized protein n=1 Tax=Dyadobacter subterraneus TaxID=2773304 RepID=A0ABR9WHV3_9BACT|nr:hypothetical protein [Dyadobacter subterraneus]MBE9465102.1 hypothetical protein [Dyadobacter subterraneus]